MVLVQMAPGADKEKLPTVPSGPRTLEAVLQALSEAGYVRARLQGHEIARADGTRNYTVKATGPTVFEVAVTDTTKELPQGAAPPKPTPTNISTYMDIGVLKKSPYLSIISKLQFNATTSRFTFGYPEVHLQKTYRFCKGDFLNLAWS